MCLSVCFYAEASVILHVPICICLCVSVCLLCAFRCASVYIAVPSASHCVCIALCTLPRWFCAQVSLCFIVCRCKSVTVWVSLKEIVAILMCMYVVSLVSIWMPLLINTITLKERNDKNTQNNYDRSNIIKLFCCKQTSK